jgi:di/tricarboxylate transporter
VEAAGLRDLGSAYLVHVRRMAGPGRGSTETVVAAEPETVLLSGDVLSFIGDAGAMDGLLQQPGLERTVPVLEGAASKTEGLAMFEAVVAPGSSLGGRTLKEADFRERYGGVVLAIQRQDAPIEGALGRVPLRAGDLLLIEGRAPLRDRLAEHSADFALVAPLGRSRPVHGKAPIALGILVAMIVVAGAGWAPLETAALVAALAMVLTGCLKGTAARRAVELPVLVVVASALAIGLAVEKSGLAGVAAKGVLTAGSALGPVAMIAVVYACTNVLTELVTHKAAVVLMLPVALAVAKTLGAEPKAFAVAVCIAAAASFLTPIGYQTNLMVMAPGGYRYGDYFRSGFPVSLLVMAVTVTACVLVWL